ncbi:hypothetical protein [Acinetobacter sp. 5862]|uniref:hypothetical protein n=1 Tax=Acinetobacter sp. 5862 TaxID=2967169 RepID=UPI0021129E4A|nr:hypothetical protein [Acinetobacter sp. 5862]
MYWNSYDLIKIPYSNFFNTQYSLGVSATGHIENPHHRPFNAANIRQLFTLGLSLDVDYYFA